MSEAEESLSSKINEEYEKSKIYTNLEFLSDFKIITRGEPFCVHKVILAKESPYFYQLFQKDGEIKELNILDIDIEPTAFNNILHYMYSNEYPKHGSYDVILAAADILKMKNLKNYCETQIEKLITTENVCQFLILSVEFSAKMLFEDCMSLILRGIDVLDFCILQCKPLVVLSMLEEIFERRWMMDSYVITESINLSFEKKIETNPNCFQGIDSFLNNEKYSDVTFIVGEETFRGHKMILSAKSPVFDRMLSSEMKEALTNVVVIEDMEPEVFYEVLRYIYTGKVKFPQNVFQILKAADYYNIEDLKNFTEKYLAEKLTDLNVVDIVKFADTYNAFFLLRHCSQYIVKRMIFKLEMGEKIPFSLEMFVDCQNNFFYEILNVLIEFCEIKFIELNESISDYKEPEED
ncbi:ankyrin repeat and BTB/POZ domain-containing protein BTBD11-B-like [Leptopilina heterotoma]|uniref:ankyrin repeat and BTB/POZ domain-containing protein BTBD11-B-like n=1 Tax=Leptopilina heterotoma TaxID=63436 RepID=UPI001CA956BF|nr:ankyrin repeat and BTB/POZ domain-containing protein BTBD11-B-like [Leptopilina heterotoma]